MSANGGCGVPFTWGQDQEITCGTFLGLGEAAPVLCPTCHAAAYQRTCEGCGTCPAFRDRPPFLCASCQAEYVADRYAAGLERGTPGSRCSRHCGYCGRCGSA